MISILIPTYNYDVNCLVEQLIKQAQNCNILYELICIDDGSNSKVNLKNERINNLANCKFIAFQKNKGLSTTRNILAEEAKYEYLLFIDGDSIIINDNYVNSYINAIKKNKDVIYGGRLHPEQASANRKLRWKYGFYIEDSSALSRTQNPYKCILFNNTLIKKSIFNKIKFNNNIKTYGHEDTLFAFDLFNLNASVLHIENPILHGDIDLNKVYFLKTCKSLSNLNKIYSTGLINPNFITFLKIFEKLKFWKLNYIFAYTHIILHPLYKIQLTSNKPSLFVFNLFRVSYFCNINLKK